MGKGSRRRREDTAAVEANWPFPEKPKKELHRCPYCGDMLSHEPLSYHHCPVKHGSHRP